MKPKTLKKLIRPVLVIATGISAFSVTNAALRSNVEEPETRLQKVGLALAATAISGVVADRAADWMGTQYDALYDGLHSFTKDDSSS